MNEGAVQHFITIYGLAELIVQIRKYGTKWAVVKDLQLGQITKLLQIFGEWWISHLLFGMRGKTLKVLHGARGIIKQSPYEEGEDHRKH